MCRSFFLLLLLFTTEVFPQEICNNGSDDDADGLVDLNDAECECSTLDLLSDFIEDPTMEGLICSPVSFGDWDCAISWSGGTQTTTDLLVQGSSSWINAVPLPLPDGGQVCIGGVVAQDYREFLATCLVQPLVPGEVYTMHMNMAAFRTNGSTIFPLNGLSPLEVTVYGSATCPNLPLPSGGCPGDIPTWMPIGTVQYTPSDDWSSLTFDLSPTQSVLAIQIGPPCGPLPSDYPMVNMPYPYLLYDNIEIFGQVTTQTGSIDVSGDRCSNDLVLFVSQPAGQVQWYYDGIAILGATEASLFLDTALFLPGTYQAIITNGIECSTAEVYVHPPPSMDLMAIVEPEQGCTPHRIAFSGMIQSGNVSMLWSFGDGTFVEGANGEHVYETRGVYPVSVLMVSDQGCIWDTIPIAEVTVDPTPTAHIHHLTHVEVLGNVTILAWNTIETIGQNWSLWCGSWIEHSNASQATFDLGYDVHPPAQLQLVVTNEFGCVDTALTIISWTEEQTVHAPNAFTPDGDGINDLWYPVSTGPDIFRWEVIDRWGRSIWQSNDLDDAWDGNVAGFPCPVGVYAWRVMEMGDQRDEIRTGHMVLIR